jgi:hypothetical protein
MQLHEEKQNLEIALREKIRTEYINLMSDLVNLNMKLKSQFDIYR